MAVDAVLVRRRGRDRLLRQELDGLGLAAGRDHGAHLRRGRARRHRLAALRRLDPARHVGGQLLAAQQLLHLLADDRVDHRGRRALAPLVGNAGHRVHHPDQHAEGVGVLGAADFTRGLHRLQRQQQPPLAQVHLKRRLVGLHLVGGVFLELHHQLGGLAQRVLCRRELLARRVGVLLLHSGALLALLRLLLGRRRRGRRRLLLLRFSALGRRDALDAA
mmetsp:Transcript_29161/g.73245  ORF Transcript_29161/g.73245 Transcript_29161/m.73245 type:complete len:219 (+) Transcript_29161:215-871(+)